MDNYIPGVCNIGVKERQFRRNIGIVAGFISVAYLVVILALKLELVAKLLIFIPIFTAVISYLQFRMHFCAEFGILGKYNFSKNLGRALSVEETEALLKDRATALKIILYSFVLSFVATATIIVLL